MLAPGSSRLALLAAGVLWSLGGVFIKAFTGGAPGVLPVSAAGICCYRSLFAALVLLPFLPRLRALKGHRPWELGVPVFLFAALLGLYVASTQGTTAANAIFLQYTAPFYVILLSPPLLREPLRRPDLLTLAIAALGVGILAGSGIRGIDRAAIAMGFGSGLFFGLFLLWMRRLREIDPLAITAWNNLAVALIFAAWLAVTPAGQAELRLPARALAAEPGTALTLGLLVLMGLVQIAAPYVLFSWGLRGVGGVEASLLTLIEPVLNPVWVVLFIGERPAPATLLGGGLILAALALRYTLWRERSGGADS